MKEDSKTIPRLLSPVKSFNGAIRVIDAGADEIYCDVVKPEIRNFTLYRGTLSEVPSYQDLGKIVKYAHDHNVSVDVAVNVPFTTDSMNGTIRKHIRSCIDQGVDALIIGDFGILNLVKKMMVDLPLVASSYTEATNYGAVAFLERQGFKRVILERHLTIDEISDIVRHSNIEIEVMIHGSGCSNINGNCYLYHYGFPGMRQAYSELTDLKYPCTVMYEIYDVDKGNEMIGREQVLDAYTFCSLCKLLELVKVGVNGLKIVGRELNEEYQERTTRIYRELLDLIEGGRTTAVKERLEYLKDNFMPFPPSIATIRDLFCEYNRCYYGPFFNAPYKLPRSWKVWTEFRFESMVFEGEDRSSG